MCVHGEFSGEVRGGAWGQNWDEAGPGRQGWSSPGHSRPGGPATLPGHGLSRCVLARPLAQQHGYQTLRRLAPCRS